MFSFLLLFFEWVNLLVLVHSLNIIHGDLTGVRAVVVSLRDASD